MKRHLLFALAIFSTSLSAQHLISGVNIGAADPRTFSIGATLGAMDIFEENSGPSFRMVSDILYNRSRAFKKAEKESAQWNLCLQIVPFKTGKWLFYGGGGLTLVTDFGGKTDEEAKNGGLYGCAQLGAQHGRIALTAEYVPHWTQGARLTVFF